LGIWFGPPAQQVKSAGRHRRQRDKKPLDQRTKLYLFDFDGTIFRSPGLRPDQTVEEWFPGSLGESSGVPKNPNMNWYLENTVKAFKEAQKDPDAVVAVVTGRWAAIYDQDTGALQADFESRLLELLQNAGLYPDVLRMKDVNLHPVGSTPEFKRDTALELIQSMPNLKQLKVYDDTEHHRKMVADAALKAGLRHVKDCGAPFDECRRSQELESEDKPDARHVSETGFDVFLEEFYEGGKMLVPNLNPETKDRFPQVQVETLIKSYPPYAESLKRKYRTWVGQGALRNPRRKKAQLTRVAQRWLKAARGRAKKDVGHGGLDEWFSGHGEGKTKSKGKATWGDWVAISPVTKTVKTPGGKSKKVSPGDIVGPCGISKKPEWKDVTDNGKDPLKCMPRQKAYNMPKSERAEVAKGKMKAERKDKSEGKKTTRTPTFK
jgi:hypothetical protein